MITDTEIEKAVDYLRDSAPKAAEARAQAEHLENMRHVILARIAGSMNGGSEASKDRQARASQEYGEFLDGLKVAIQADHEYRNLRVAAEAKIEAWRTLQANLRGVDRVG